MQALSCGLPVIASDVAGVSNMVRPEVGLLYRPSDTNDLVDKMRILVCSPQEIVDWGTRARRYAVDNYAVAETVKSYEFLIHSMGV